MVRYFQYFIFHFCFVKIFSHEILHDSSFSVLNKLACFEVMHTTQSCFQFLYAFLVFNFFHSRMTFLIFYFNKSFVSLKNSSVLL